MRSRSRADADRLADVQRPSRAVAEHVHAGPGGQRPEVDVRRGARRRHQRAGRPAATRAPATTGEQVERVPHGGRGGTQAPEQSAEDARAGLGVGQSAVHGGDLDVQRARQRRQPALADQRGKAPGQRHRAQHRRVGPPQPGAGERSGQSAPIESGAVGDHHPSLQTLGHLAQHAIGRRRGGQHRSADPGQALDGAHRRAASRHQRLVTVVQLAPAHQHRADLRQLAVLAPTAGCLHVDDQELGRAQRLVAQHHAPCLRRPADGLQRHLRGTDDCDDGRAGYDGVHRQERKSRCPPSPPGPRSP